LWVISVDGKEEPHPFLQTEFSEDLARFSPDGHWVVYQSNEAGRNEIYVRPYPSGSGKWQISANGGSQPIWSRDGKEIFYSQSNGLEMVAKVNGAGDAFTVG